MTTKNVKDLVDAITDLNEALEYMGDESGDGVTLENGKAILLEMRAELDAEIQLPPGVRSTSHFPWHRHVTDIIW